MANQVVLDRRGFEYGHKNDCTVRTLSCATDIPYEQAFDILSRLGRDDNKGFVFEKVVKGQS